MNLGVNYLAIIVAAIAAVAIGIVYYGILGVGDRQSRMLGASPTRPGPLSLNLGAASITDAILLGALVWLGFGATFKAAQVAFERRPWGLWVLQGVHDLIVEVVVAGIVTLWR